MTNTTPATATEKTMTAEEIEAELAADPEFAAVCDARREAWLEALEAVGPEG
jgi:hypothetical protein